MIAASATTIKCRLHENRMRARIPWHVPIWNEAIWNAHLQWSRTHHMWTLGWWRTIMFSNESRICQGCQDHYQCMEKMWQTVWGSMCLGRKLMRWSIHHGMTWDFVSLLHPSGHKSGQSTCTARRSGDSRTGCYPLSGSPSRDSFLPARWCMPPQRASQGIFWMSM